MRAGPVLGALAKETVKAKASKIALGMLAASSFCHYSRCRDRSHLWAGTWECFVVATATRRGGTQAKERLELVSWG